jgi:hypothetical protein
MMVCSFCGFAYAYVAFRNIGYVYDEDTDERYTIIGMDGGDVAHDGKTWKQRKDEEIICRNERRTRLAIFIVGASFVVYIYYNLRFVWFPYDIINGNLKIAVIMLWLVAAGIFLSPVTMKFYYRHFIVHLWNELRYLFGDQRMNGARVIYPRPAPKIREIVEQQKVHGKAQAATEREATGRKGRRPPASLEFDE